MQKVSHYDQITRRSVELCPFALAFRGANPVPWLPGRERVPLLPLPPSAVVVDVPALARGALPRRPSFRVRAERFPVLRQVQSLAFEREPLPVALQPCIRAHLCDPIRDDNARLGKRASRVRLTIVEAC